ncbi:MAG TPA: P-loop NTPase fold protein [Rhodocyclaceae bacterium]|nr:P-loop NTPase fold protein [Rhodocyclaceae bacterium]
MTNKKQIEPWSDDKLDRKDAATFLTSYMTKRFGQQAHSLCSDSFVLNLNCGWGFGKTYFLKNWREDLQTAGYPVIYFDAWKNDFSDEPLLGFIAELDEGLAKIFHRQAKGTAQSKGLIAAGKRLLKPALPVLLAALLKKGFGLTQHELKEFLAVSDEDSITVSEVAGKDGDTDNALPETLSKAVELAAENALKQHFTMRQSMVEFQESLGKIVQNLRKSQRYELPIFIMVDELDRCRPLYAIELLETIKHLFGVAGVCFVIATDTRQLASSIKAVYGNDFEAELYLKRFFDQEYILPEPNYYSFAEFLLSRLQPSGLNLFSPFEKAHNGSLNLPSLYFAALAEACQLDLRGQLQVFNSFQAICTILPDRAYLHLPLIFFLLMLRQTSPKEFDEYWRAPNMTKLGKFSFNDEKIFAGFKKSAQGATPASYGLKELIATYTHLLAEPDTASLARKMDQKQDIHVNEILRNIVNTTWTASKQNVLRSYFDLVRQAGQLT